MQFLRAFLRAVTLFATLFTIGCSAFLEPGSLYERTDKISDLVSEPTLDIGWDFDQFNGMSVDNLWEHYYDVDGHGLFDVFTVATEELIFVPGLLLFYAEGGVSLLPSEEQAKGNVWERVRASDALRYPCIGIMWVLGCCAGCYDYAALGCVAVYDPLVHDLPVILVGRPYARLRRALQRGGSEQVPQGAIGSPPQGDPRQLQQNELQRRAREMIEIRKLEEERQRDRLRQRHRPQ